MLRFVEQHERALRGRGARRTFFSASLPCCWSLMVGGLVLDGDTGKNDGCSYARAERPNDNGPSCVKRTRTRPGLGWGWQIQVTKYEEESGVEWVRYGCWAAGRLFSFMRLKASDPTQGTSIHSLSTLCTRAKRRSWFLPGFVPSESAY